MTNNKEMCCEILIAEHGMTNTNIGDLWCHLIVTTNVSEVLVVCFCRKCRQNISPSVCLNNSPGEETSAN